ncbi:MAG TPA: F0F1 ATP synthase subunit A [Gemmataceae bacterium]|nr:F0F1 ATP synthase subunit A [Gemmataceae bacterium]
MAQQKLDPFSHVVDSDHFVFFDTADWVIHDVELFGIPMKFILLMTVCAVSVGVAMIWLGYKMKDGDTPKGYIWNLLESLLFFVRNKIARPGIGEEEADKYLPLLLTFFLFIFAMDLMGLIPFLASPTASIMVTGALALVSFVVIHVSGVKDHGVNGYLRTFVPHIHLEGGVFMQAMGWMIMVGMAALEYVTAFIRAGVLAVRLFANMLAGHTVLFMILSFITLVANPVYQLPVAKDWMFWPVTIFSVMLVTALSLLELFIAGLQAFIFTFLTAVFIGLAKHPPH